MISFVCSQCGLKLQVKPEFAGRSSRCPTCKKPLVVPAPDKTQLDVAAGQIDGTDSSLAKAGVDGGITLGAAARPGQQSIGELLARRTRKDGRYIIEGEIARGGMGTVLRAVDCDIRREVAVKYLLDQSDTGKKLRFIEEAQITGQLEHPNIVPIHELGIDALQRVFFSMKMVRGRSLAQVLDQLRQHPNTAEKEFSLGRLLNIFSNVCNALAYAHSRGVVHRDLKPANIMLGDFGEVYVMDWGLGRVLSANGPQAPAAAPLATVVAGGPSAGPAAIPLSGMPTAMAARWSKVATSREPEADLTQEGAVLGTPVYMPPEQASGNIQAIDQRSDVYSLGAILYEMLTLHPPVDKDGGYLTILMRVIQGEIVPPEQRTRSIPRELSAIAMKALARQPQDRYPSVEALRQDIERFQEGRSVSAKEDTKWEMVVKFAKRNKAFSATSTVALLVLLVVLLFTFQNYHEKEARTRKAVPAFLRAGQLAVNERQFKDALDQATVAVDFDPDNAQAHLFKGQLLIVQQQFSQAQLELEKYRKLRPADGTTAKLLSLCQQARPEDATTCLAFADLFSEHKEYGLADGMLQGFGTNAVEARKKLYDLYRKRIDAAWPGVGGGLSVDASGKFSLNVGEHGQVSDLGPLRGMPLSALDLSRCRELRDLTPLHRMPLTRLNLTACSQVRDLAPLHGMPLTQLDLTGCVQLSDLTPLQNMPLSYLSLNGCNQVRDFSLLQGLPLTSLNLSDCQAVPDLTSLRGMRLTSLILYRCRRITDLSPLQGMPLTLLHLEGCPEIKDLMPLQGMKLATLNLGYCRGVQDLTPLRGMPLTSLDVAGCGARDLSPLEGMPLTEVGIEPKGITQGMNVLRRMTTLKSISIGVERRERLTPEQFWKKYDAGEFKK